MKALSKITFGTAQLGMQYGIANRTGQPTVDQAMDLLTEAAAGGVTCIDTSPAYGESEQLIGRFLARQTQPRQFSIVTKLPPLSGLGKLDKNILNVTVNNAVHQSLQTIGVEQLDYYLLHAENDFRVYGDSLFDVLRCCRDQGIIGRFGVSVYSPDIAVEALEAGAEALEIPCNLFDRRWIDKGILSQATKYGATVFARSLFLQGLFFLPAREVSLWFPMAVPYLNTLLDIVGDSGIPLAEIAFSAIRDLPGVNSLVIGMETIAQINENLSLLSRPPLDEGLQRVIAEQFSSVPNTVINPSLWPESI